MGPMNELTGVLKARDVSEKAGIYVAKEIAERTVWDKLAVKNPHFAVISAKDEVEAEAKSIAQIEDMMQFLEPGQVLLDVGCGYGRVAQYLLPRLKLGGYIGADSSYEMLSLFKKRYDSREEEQRTPVLLVNAEIHTLPIKDASVDAIIVCAVFLHNHKEVVEAAMREIERVLKPGGTMLVYSSFPRGATLMGMQGYAYQGFLNLMGRRLKNGPVRYYRSYEIKRLFNEFDSIELRPVGFAALPKTFIGLPQPFEVLYRKGVANPLNGVLARITPRPLRRYFAVHYDVIAKR